MTLLFDENLSPRLPHKLEDCFSSAVHVEVLGLKGRDDADIWRRSCDFENAIIVSKDDDFRELALNQGPPPKVLILLVGNCRTVDIEKLLRKNEKTIREFAESPGVALLELSP